MSIDDALEESITQTTTNGQVDNDASLALALAMSIDDASLVPINSWEGFSFPPATIFEGRRLYPSLNTIVRQNRSKICDTIEMIKLENLLVFFRRFAEECGRRLCCKDHDELLNKLVTDDIIGMCVATKEF